jgi:hypothetical protein
MTAAAGLGGKITMIDMTGCAGDRIAGANSCVDSVPSRVQAQIVRVGF